MEVTVETVTLNLDEELYGKSMLILKKCGLDINEAIILFLKQCVKENKIPFDFSLDTVKDLSRVSDKIIGKYLDAYRELAK